MAFLLTAVVSFLAGRASIDGEQTALVAQNSPVQPRTQVDADPPEVTGTTAVGPVAVDPADDPVVAVARALSPSVVQLTVDLGLGRTSVGSGFIYDNAGRLLTNAHVVGEATEVNVRLASGTQVLGTVVGADPVSDVAVVQIDDPENTAPAVLALGSEPLVGQAAVVLGSPFGLEGSVTLGIVSAINRPLTVEPDSGAPPQAMIQTDAAINSGNSGGPLADLAGRVIGINSAIFTRSGGADGVGFAIPIDRAVEIAELLVAGESIEGGLLGVSGTNPASGPAGALIGSVSPDSGAESAGIAVGDLITKVDDRAIRSMSDLGAIIRSKRPGDVVTIEFTRDGQDLETIVTLGSE